MYFVRFVLKCQRLCAANLIFRAQYANVFGVIGRIGPNGLNTLFLEDLTVFFVKEDLPALYALRDFTFYSSEANTAILTAWRIISDFKFNALSRRMIKMAEM